MELSNLISLKEACSISGLSSDHLRRLAEQGKLKAKKIAPNCTQLHLKKRLSSIYLHITSFIKVY